jgi:hypothetical protein
MRIPESLEPGTFVKLVARDIGSWTVEAHGHRWAISITNVDHGEECFVAGEWRHESHRMVREELARLRTWTREDEVD